MAALTASVLVLGLTMAPARASLPGENGKIAYSHGESSSSIFVVNTDGTGRTNVTTDADLNTTPAWAPDGTKIAFASNTDEKDGYEIYAMDVNGRNLRRLTDVPGSDSYPDWQPLPGTTPPKDADCSDIVQVTTNSGGNDGDHDRKTPLGPTEAKTEKQQEERKQIQQQQPKQGSKSRSVTVHPPDTGGLSLSLVASALLFSGASCSAR